MSRVKHYITRVVLISWTKCKVEVFLWLLGWGGGGGVSVF